MFWFVDYPHRYSSLSYQSWLDAFKLTHPDHPFDLLNKHQPDIRKRYLPAPFPWNIREEVDSMRWCPEYEVIVEESNALDLLDSIWEGQQKHVVAEMDLTTFVFCEYWIDFDNRVLKVKGVSDRGMLEDCMTIPFESLVEGDIVRSARAVRHAKELAELEEATAKLDLVD
jgi:hypothetical protein